MGLNLKVTKSDELLEWMKSKGTFANHEIIAWGLRNYYSRALRTSRDFQRDGLIEKLSPQAKEAYGYKCKDDVHIYRRVN